MAFRWAAASAGADESADKCKGSKVFRDHEECITGSVTEEGCSLSWRTSKWIGTIRLAVASGSPDPVLRA